jgi:ATP-dependent Lhr-like helicase
MSFERLSPGVREVVRDFVPTEIQKLAIPKVLDGINLLLIAPTGSGKTEAVVLPLFQMLLDMGEEGRRGIRLLYITPLRALNRDMLRRMDIIKEKLGLTVGVRHGDTPQVERTRQSKDPPQMLITTPETFQLLLLGRNLRKGLERVRWVVIDEIHELAEDERGAQLSVALERLSKVTKRDFQRIGLSATVGSPEEFAKFLSGGGKEAEIVMPPMAKRMKITVHSIPGATEKPGEGTGASGIVVNTRLLSLCRSLIESHTSTLFFVNTRDTAEWLAASFRSLDETFPIGIHHGSLSKEVRVQMEDDFKGGMLKCLICTSSLELGIDVGSADYVIQYNSPRQVTRLVQRVGRAGHRLDRLSEGIILSANPDELLESAVIAKNAMRGKYEETRVRKKPLAVLANQAVAFTMAEGEVGIGDMHRTVAGAHPFRDLTAGELEKVVRTLADLREVRFDGAIVGRGRAAMEYFYDNISMIPDEKNYMVRDVATRKPIGTLDENFVATYADTDLTFIFRGTSWRIVETKGEEILVEQVRELGTLPSWAGEELPVPFEIAHEVGSLRRTGDFSAYPVSKDAAAICSEYLAGQKEFPVADDRTVVIEASPNRRLLVINACFGTKVNETLGRYIAAMLSAKFGESVGLETDAYRICIETPVPVNAGDVEQILMTTDPDSLESIMRLVLRGTAVFRWQFLSVAKKFGAVMKDADFRALNLNKLIDLYTFSPIYQEAMQRTMWEKMDVGKAAQIIRLLQEGEMEIKRVGNLSPMGVAGFESKRELLVYGRADRVILNALRERLNRTEMLLACLSCKLIRKLKVSDVDERVRCWSCGGVLVSAIHPYERKVLDVLRKKSFTESDRKALRRLQKSANLVLSGGRRAVMALAGRGIGADTAGRILERPYRGEDEFLKAVLEAEVNYAKTRRFWD